MAYNNQNSNFLFEKLSKSVAFLTESKVKMGWEKHLGIQSAFVHERKGAAPKLQKHSFIPFYFFFFSYIYEGTNGSRNVVCFRLSRPHDFPSTSTKKGAKRPFPNSFPYVSTCIRDSGRRQRVQTGTNYHMIQVY